VLLSQNKIVGVELEVSRAFCQRNPGKYLRSIEEKVEPLRMPKDYLIEFAIYHFFTKLIKVEG
jgi:hypothetical protein